MSVLRLDKATAGCASIKRGCVMRARRTHTGIESAPRGLLEEAIVSSPPVRELVLVCGIFRDWLRAHQMLSALQEARRADSRTAS